MKKNYFIGIDVSKKNLDIAIYDEKGKSKENHLVIKNEATGFENFINWLKLKNITYEDIFICMEHTGLYSFEFQIFLEKMNIYYCMESGLRIKKSIGITRGKDDKIDAFRIAEYCYEKQEKLAPTVMPSKEIFALRRLISERKRYTQMLAKHKVIAKEIAKYESEIAQKRTIETIEFIKKKITDIEEELLQIINSEPSIKQNYSLLYSIKGIGIVNAINTIVFTNNFTAFSSPREYTCYIGVAPFPNRSGSSIHGKTSVSKLGNSNLKAELTQAALNAIRWDAGLKNYFNRKIKEKGGGRSNYGIVLNAVKFKLICRMFAVIKRQTPYIELSYN